MMITPGETSDPIAPNDNGWQKVFVFEFPDSPVLAFEAKSSSDANEIVRSPSFTRAIGGFRSKRRMAGVSNNLLRAATDAETSIFRGIACEFSDLAGAMLIANLSSWNVC
jgi:hypothetical protein